MIDFKKEGKDYLALLTILSFGLAAFVYFGYNLLLQTIVIVLVAVLYVAWGIFHHLLQGDFHFKILLEYIVVAFFGVVLIMALLGRT
jgi:hypothetical protein